MIKSTKTLNCAHCGNPVLNVGEDAAKVTCSKCVITMIGTNTNMSIDIDDDTPNEFTRNN